MKWSDQTWTALSPDEFPHSTETPFTRGDVADHLYQRGCSNIYPLLFSNSMLRPIAWFQVPCLSLLVSCTHFCLYCWQCLYCPPYDEFTLQIFFFNFEVFEYGTLKRSINDFSFSKVFSYLALLITSSAKSKTIKFEVSRFWPSPTRKLLKRKRTNKDTLCKQKHFFWVGT